MWACPTLIIISDSQIITDHGSLFQNVSCFTPHFLSCSFVCHLSSSPSFGAPGYTSGGNCQIRKSALSLSLSLPLCPPTPRCCLSSALSHSIYLFLRNSADGTRQISPQTPIIESRCNRQQIITATTRTHIQRVVLLQWSVWVRPFDRGLKNSR